MSGRYVAPSVRYLGASFAADLDVGMPEIQLAARAEDACTVTSRARDGRVFACWRPRGHALEHYGRDGRGPVRLGFGR